MVTRISGFASGLDIDKLVADLMKARRAPLDKLTQKKTTLEWQREQYREMNIKLVDFRNNKLSSYGLSNSISAKQANVTGNMTAVSAKATGSSQAGNMTIKVDSLATAAYARSAATGSYTADTALTDASIGLTASGGNISFDINGKTIQVGETATVSDMVSAINASSAGVTAFFENGKLSLMSKELGGGAITFSATNDLETAFGLTDAAAGASAQVYINGIQTTRSSNTFTVNGVEITLNATSGGTTSNINIVSDTDKVVDTIKSFIKDYNDILDSVNKKLNEERFRKFPPLTTEQKAEMKDSEIELWEDKAKSGLLRRDTTLTSLVSDMRLASYTKVQVGATAVSLNDFGIETGDWEQRGKLVIKDESKLREAIEATPDLVSVFFSQMTSETDADLKKSPTNPDNGLFNRLSNIVMSSLDMLAEKAGTSKYSTEQDTSFLPDSMMGEELRLLDIRISDMNARMTQIETQYYKQFTAMEVAINRYNAQASALFGAS